MKTIDLGSIAQVFEVVEKSKSLSSIVAEARLTKASLNPYSVAAKRIITAIHKEFFFPFLQPAVVNPLEFTGEEVFYYHDKRESPKFPIARFATKLGMDPPADVKLCIGSDHIPFFLNIDDLATAPCTLDYRVFDYSSLRKFIVKLSTDMSFLHPITRSEVIKQSNAISQKNFARGDIVLIPGQKYGRIGLVEDVVIKDYTALFFSPDEIHTPRIGVNNTDLTAKADRDWRDEVDEMIVAKNLFWVNEITQARLPLGSAASVVGWSTAREDNAIIGYCSIIANQTPSAVVVPHSFDKNEPHPWGNIGRLSIPISELTKLGSLEELSTGGHLDRKFFPDYSYVMSVLRDIAWKEVEDPYVQGLLQFTELSRYRRIYSSLRDCPQVPASLLGSQFVNIVTQNGIEGIERLAQISGKDSVEVARELLVEDIHILKRSLSSGKKRYGTYISEVENLVRQYTPFRSFAHLMANASPKVNVYEMERDGVSTLAHVQSLELLSIPFNRKVKTEKKPDMPRDEDDEGDDFEFSQTRERIGEKPVPLFSPDSIRRKIFDQMNQRRGVHVRKKNAEYLQKELIPYNGQFRMDWAANLLLSVRYRIPIKDSTIRYGHDEHMELTKPSLKLVSDDTIILPISSNAEFGFYHDIVKALSKSRRFAGAKKFFSAYNELVAQHDKPPSEEDSDIESIFIDKYGLDEGLLREIQPFYRGVCQLTRNSAMRDKLATELLKDEPLLVEAFYDYKYLQQMIAIRDHYFRDEPYLKRPYVDQFGFLGKIHSCFADEFYRVLSSIDMYHRGFAADERHIQHITRAKQYSRGDGKTTLGSVASASALALVGNVEQRFETLGQLLSTTAPAMFLGAMQTKKLE